MNIISEAEIPGGAASAAINTSNGEPVGPAFRLQIIRLEGEDGFYLIRYDAAGRELTDTLHEGIEEALNQAQFEYGVTPDLWKPPAY
jgi:hypothetical protein